MPAMRVSDVVKATGGRLLAGKGGTLVEGFSTDSRSISAGEMFVPLKGENFDGMFFVASALDAGAAGALVTRWNEKLRKSLRPAIEAGAAMVKVDDGLRAFQRLAAHARSGLKAEVIGITGSTGKTTTKDFLSAMLRPSMNVVASQRSFNNEIGVPATILSADSDTDVLVLEMAMRGEGQIRQLCEIARPQAGLVTNVGKTHYEFLGSEARIAEAKGELVEAIGPGGFVVLNADDYWTHKLRAMAKAEVITYGTKSAADVQADEIEIGSDGCASFVLRTGGRRKKIRLRAPGRHNVYNAAAAAAVALNLGASLKDVAAGARTVALSGMRMELFTTADDVVVLNDAYNANPASVQAALETLHSIQSPGKKIAVLGDMMELGTMSDVAHFQVGEIAARLGLDALVTVGALSRRIAEGAIVAGMDPERVSRCETGDEAGSAVRKLLAPSDVVLVKASRAMKLETVVERLT
ncbi:MAG: UDP-N-acetylmuramoyl-tripeptide--D-alanyl-D-alanine ligase [Actinobacteria bacterium]|nr:MAG: UDP-N-acetylmuramoyl-tripeptide--D-alanyl-D-alanine ligase [Actinomycetota bacterium]